MTFKPNQNTALLARTPKPFDYPTVLNVAKGGEEKQLHHYSIKFWWKVATNGKDTYVLNGQQLFDTYLKNGIVRDSVLKAMISKYNEMIVKCQKIEIYDNSNYGNIIKLVVWNGAETLIHDKVNNKMLGCLHGSTAVSFLVK